MIVAVELGNAALRGGRVLARDRVQAKEEAVERKALDEREAIALDGLVVGRVDQVEALDAAALERLEARRRIGDRPDDQPIQVGRVSPQ